MEALRLQIERRREARLAAASARRAWGAKDGKGGVGAKDHSSGSLGSRIPRLRHGCHGSNANSSNGSGATSPASIASSAASPSDRHGGFTFTSSVSPAADAAEAALQHRRRQQGDSPVGLRQQLERMVSGGFCPPLLQPSQSVALFTVLLSLPLSSFLFPLCFAVVMSPLRLTMRC